MDHAQLVTQGIIYNLDLASLLFLQSRIVWNKTLMVYASSATQDFIWTMEFANNSILFAKLLIWQQEIA